MAILRILTEEEPRLRKISRPVTEITPRIKTLLSDMAQTMRKADGVGLAAPQVGVLRRIVVIEAAPGELLELINPEILEKSGSQTGPEGCLSLPGKQGIVTRPSYVKLKALDRNGVEQIYEGHDLCARAMCHECDHLDGILYPDKADKMLTEEEINELYGEDDGGEGEDED